MSNCIRSSDFFAIPVQLTYKGDREFNTLLGGFCSLFLLVVVASGLAYNVHSYWDRPRYLQSEQKEYINFHDNHYHFNMSSLN